jgi:hypothetical protein
LKWRIFLASKFSELKSHINPGSCHGEFSWRVILAHLFGGFSWQENQTGLKRSKAKEKKSKLCVFRGPVDGIMNIVYSQ